MPYQKPAYVIERVQFNERQVEVANDAWGVVAIVVVVVEIVANCIPPVVS